MTRAISCELADRWLSRAIDEEITSEEEQLLESHLDTCPRCREERDRLAVEIGRIDRGFAGISEELDALLRGRMGPEQILDAEIRSSAAPRGRRLGALAAVVAMALVAALLFWTLPDGSATAPRVIVEWGDAGVEWTSDGVLRSFAGSGEQSLVAGDRLRLPAGGDARLTFPDGSIGRLGPQSQLAFRAIGSDDELELGIGRAAFDITPRDDAHFVVLTPLVRIEVVGTRFGVIHENGWTDVTVEEGEVVVSRRTREPALIHLGPGAGLKLSSQTMFYDSGGYILREGEPDARIDSGPPSSGPGTNAGGDAGPDPTGTTPPGSTPLDGDGERKRPLDMPPGETRGSGGGN